LQRNTHSIAVNSRLTKHTKLTKSTYRN